MKIIKWYHVNVHCPITWAVEKWFGYYSKIAKIFRRIGHKMAKKEV